MAPKIASALARVLDPIRPIKRPGSSLTTTKSSEGGEGGHGPLGYSKQEQTKKEPEKSQPPELNSTSVEAPSLKEEGLSPESAEQASVKASSLPLKPGLTQVILDLNAKRQELVAGSVSSYETGAKEQKKASRLPKGSMLDKKVG